MNPLFWAFLLSLAPVSELRGGLPFALASGVTPFIAFVVCVVGNVLIVPIVFFFLEFIHEKFLHFDSYQSVFDRFMERTRRKAGPLVEKYGVFGLALFVAVPLPVSGAYTGAAAAWFFGMNYKKAFLSILVGIILSGLIVFSVSYSGLRIFGWL
ncbi:small multi-drug export protein [Candidatus Woesearchaeota archaeon]|nr:small multi-drug export protein [Candidatus Woesearchaeota archaeon]MBW3016415.1 small multi-drug export protein [Candidatus Woesearchaeota archaeon]